MRIPSVLPLVMSAPLHAETFLLGIEFSKVVLLAAVLCVLDLLLFVSVQVCRMLPLDLQEPCVTLVESTKLVAESAKTYIVNTMVSLDIKVRLSLLACPLLFKDSSLSVLSRPIGSILAGNTRTSSSRQPSLPKLTS